MKIFLTLPSDISNFSFQCILLPSYPVLQWTHAWIISWSCRFWRILPDDLLSTECFRNNESSYHQWRRIRFHVSCHIYILHITCVIIVSYFWNHMHVCIDSMHLIFCCRWCSHRINNMSIFLLTLSDCKCSGNFKWTSF